jgi:hypothetical protein
MDPVSTTSTSPDLCEEKRAERTSATGWTGTQSAHAGRGGTTECIDVVEHLRLSAHRPASSNQVGRAVQDRQRVPAQRRRPVPCVRTTFSLSRQTAHAQMELGHTDREPCAPREDASAIGAPAPARKTIRRFEPQGAPHALTPAVGNFPLVRVWLLSHDTQTRAGAGRASDCTRHEPGLSGPRRQGPGRPTLTILHEHVPRT